MPLDALQTSIKELYGLKTLNGTFQGSVYDPSKGNVRVETNELVRGLLYDGLSSEEIFAKIAEIDLVRKFRLIQVLDVRLGLLGNSNDSQVQINEHQGHDVIRVKVKNLFDQIRASLKSERTIDRLLELNDDNNDWELLRYLSANKDELTRLIELTKEERAAVESKDGQITTSLCLERLIAKLGSFRDIPSLNESLRARSEG